MLILNAKTSAEPQESQLCLIFLANRATPQIAFDETYLKKIDITAGILPEDDLERSAKKLASFLSSSLRFSAEDSNKAALILGVAMKKKKISLEKIEAHFKENGIFDLDYAAFYTNCL